MSLVFSENTPLILGIQNTVVFKKPDMLTVKYGQVYYSDYQKKQILFQAFAGPIHGA